MMKPVVKKILKRSARVACWMLGSVLVLMVVSFALLNTHAVQNWLKDMAVEMLSKKLQTSVVVDDVSVKFFSHDVKLHGLHIKDQQNRKMLDVESVAADVGLLGLLSGEVRVTDVQLAGIEAHIYKSGSDSVANYQFLIDALASDHEVESKGKKLRLDVNEIDVERVKITYNDYALTLDRLLAKMDGSNLSRADVKGVSLSHNGDSLALNQLRVKMNGEKVSDAALKGLTAKWKRPNRQGVMVDFMLRLEKFAVTADGKLWNTQMTGLRYTSNNHLPRKNVKNPHRGYYDSGHLDLTTNLKATVDYASADSLHGKITECVAVDKVTGIDVRDLQCTLAANRQHVRVSNVQLRQINSKATFASGDIRLPDDAHAFSFSTSRITVHAIPCDISRPFAPALKDFTMPMRATALMSGSMEQINLNDVHVSTTDNQFQALASGTVRGFRYPEKHELHAHIDVKQMVTTPTKVEEMLKQLPVKRFMMKPLHGLRSISYAGSFDVFWKKEQFRGSLKTQPGDIDFEFTVDGLNQYLTGTASTASLDAGKLLDMSKIGKASLNATFKFDISGPRTAAMRRNRGGKLPIGEAWAHVDEASYGILKVHDIDLSVKSDGVTAEGELIAPHKFMDLSCSFSFVDTDNLNKLKVRPHVGLHHSNDDDSKQAKGDNKNKEEKKKGK